MKFTITTPLYYVNDKPHIGSAYTTVACDALARYKRLKGYDVLFITGVDEHGLKIQRTAMARNIEPKDHCNEISDNYKKLWDEWNVSYDTFIRTTSNDHKQLVHKFYERVLNSQDIYLGNQKGWYCVGCEEFKEVNDSEKNKFCNIHKKKLEWRDEENIFFRLSKYQKQIEELINNEGFIEPNTRKNEIKNFVDKGLKDFSISRIKLNWGIKVPDKSNHTFYVWFDALLGYLSGVKQITKKEHLEEIINSGWPADIHIIGKDILRFHAVYWPAMLISAKLPVPKKVFGHGFLTRDNQKMGKSLGNIIDPNLLIKNYGVDSVRWYLMKDFKLGNDGDFKFTRFIDIVNNDLSNTIGNLLNRTLSMSKKWFNNKIPIYYHEYDSNLRIEAINLINNYDEHINKLKYSEILVEIINLATNANIYLNEEAPWKLIKDESNRTKVSNDLYSILEVCRIIGMLINPIVPNLSIRILQQLSSESNLLNWNDSLKWGVLESKIEIIEPIPVMKKIEFIETD